MRNASAGAQQRVARRNEMQALLLRYPALEEAELDRLVQSIRREASSLDAALLASAGYTRDAWRRLHARHARRLRSPLRDAVVIGGILLLLAVAVLLLGDAGR
ncbi:MAG: hypothetical protein ACOY45_09720 [Pseudomonadota bacterium]